MVPSQSEQRKRRERTRKRLTVLCGIGLILLIITGILMLAFHIFNQRNKGENTQENFKATVEDAEPITIKHVDVDHPEPSVHLNDVSMIMDKEYGKMTETYFHGYTPGFRINVTIKMSFVTHIKLYAAYFLEYYDYYEYYDDSDYYNGLAGVKINLCDTTKTQCSFCGTVPNEQWKRATVYCSNEGAIANMVQLELVKEDVYLSEVVVFGAEIVLDEVRGVSVHRVSLFDSDGLLKDDETINRAFDGYLNTTEGSCYSSTNGHGYRMSVEIPWTLVTHVDMLAPSYQISECPRVVNVLEEAIEQTWVDVCSIGYDCLPCGVATKTDAGDWAGVYCLGGMIPGNEIQIRRPYSKINLCEVQIYGQIIKNATGAINMLNIKKGIFASNFTFDILWFDEDSTVMNTMDTNWGTAWYQCSKIRNNVAYIVSRARIHFVKILSGETQDLSLFNMTIEVCRSSIEKCTFCGTISDDSHAKWFTVFCPSGGAEGDQVAVSKPEGQRTELCEIEIYGEATS